MDDSQRLEQALKFMEAGNFEAALPEFHLLSRSSDEGMMSDGLYGELECVAAMQKADEARRLLAEFRKALGHIQEYRVRADLIEARLDCFAGHWDQALKLLDRAAERNMDLLKSPQLRDAYEEIQWRRGMRFATIGEFHLARPLLEEAVNFPGYLDGELHHQLGLCYLHDNELDKAEKEFQDAIADGLDLAWATSAHHNLGKVYMHKRAYGHAIQEFEKALKLAEQIGLPRGHIFEAMATSYKELGMNTEAGKFAHLAKAKK